jgi:hypothetical protein
MKTHDCIGAVSFLYLFLVIPARSAALVILSAAGAKDLLLSAAGANDLL